MSIVIVELDRKGLRKFGITTGIITATLFGLVLPYLFGYAWPIWPWVICSILVVWGLVLPTTLKPVYKTWMTVGVVLGWINTRIILGILFFVIFSPIALVLKLLGKDPMSRKIHIPVDSYRVTCNHQVNDHFERPY